MIPKIFLKIASHQNIAWAFAIFWTVGIFYGCSLPGNDLPKLTLFDNFDKVVHFIFFSWLYIFMAMCFL